MNKQSRESKNYNAEVDTFMKSLDSNFMTLRRHPFTERRQVDESAADEFLTLLNRTKPITDTEKTVAATIRWLYQRNRGAFIRSMFEGNYACSSLLVTGRLIEVALCAEKDFSISTGANGYRVGRPRPPQENRNGKSRRRLRGGDRTRSPRQRRNGGDSTRSPRRRRNGGDRTRSPRRRRGGRANDISVLNSSTRSTLLHEIDPSKTGSNLGSSRGIYMPVLNDKDQREIIEKLTRAPESPSYLEKLTGNGKRVNRDKNGSERTDKEDTKDKEVKPIKTIKTAKTAKKGKEVKTAKTAKTIKTIKTAKTPKKGKEVKNVKKTKKSKKSKETKESDDNNDCLAGLSDLDFEFGDDENDKSESWADFGTTEE